MAFCSNCGKELKESYKFCPKCGKAIEKESLEDDLYDKVEKYVVDSGKVSVLMIQKEFNLSNSKAKEMIEMLEKNGVISAPIGRKREVLINKIEKETIDNKFEDKVKDSIDNIMDTPDTTSNYDKKDINDNMALSILSYIGLLAFIPYFIHSDSKFVKYHATQGMNLLIMWGIYSLADQLLGLIKVSKVVVDFGSMVGTKMVTPIWISLPMDILGFILLALSITGIVYVCQGKAKELPLIGKIKIVK